MFFYRIISLFSSCRSFWRMLIVTCIKTMSLFGDVRTYPSLALKTTCTTTHHNPQKTEQSDPTNLAGELLSILVYGDDILSSSFSAKSSTHAAWPWLLNRPQMPWTVFDADVSMKHWGKIVIWLPPGLCQLVWSLIICIHWDSGRKKTIQLVFSWQTWTWTGQWPFGFNWHFHHRFHPSADSAHFHGRYKSTSK